MTFAGGAQMETIKNRDYSPAPKDSNSHIYRVCKSLLMTQKIGK